MIVESTGEVVEVGRDAKPNLPVGLFEQVKYEEHEQVLTAGAMLFLYTDGLTEARKRRHELFGRKRMTEVLQGFEPEGKPQELVQRMTTAIKEYVEDADQSDDLTMLAIRYSPEKEKDVLNETLTLKNDVHQVKVLSGFVKNITGRLNLAPKLAANVRLAVEEAVVNVMDYAYPVGLEGDICICAKSDGKRLRFIISDEGAPFDPTKALQVDTTLGVEDRPVGGLGIHLVRQLMDSINYERIDGKNTLTLIKLLKIED